MFRLIFGLIGFFSEARRVARLDPEHLQSSGEDAARLVSAHRRIVATAMIFGLIAFGAGVALAVVALRMPDPPRDARPADPAREARESKGAVAIVIVPFILGLVGLVFGACLACGFAPDEFFASPIGRKWLDMIGVSRPGPARFVCLLIASLIASAVGGVIFLFIAAPRHP